ncbi:MAG: hypothetical protein ACOC9N_01595 [Gemmatimonadota bacterium]
MRVSAACIGVIASAVALTACGDSTGPGSAPSAVERMNTEMGAVRAKLIANLDAADDVGLVAATLDTLPWPPVPPDLVGATLEWDAEAAAYVESAGAGPAGDALRFLVYDRSVDPIVEAGQADLRDLDGGDGGSLARYELHLEKHAIERLVYEVGFGPGEESGSSTFHAAGRLAGSSETVVFDVKQVEAPDAAGFRVDLDFVIELTGRSASVELDYTLFLSFFEPAASFVATYRSEVGTMVVAFVQDAANAIEGEVRLDDVPIMTITDEGGEPVFRGLAGETLPQAEAAAMRILLRFALDGFGFLLPYLVVPE